MHSGIMAKENKTASKMKGRLGRQDWILAAVQALEENGVDGIKIVVIAQQLNVTSGSFYWHFKGLRQLQNAVLNHWELALTDQIIQHARQFEGPPAERILNLMIEELPF